MKAIVYKKYGSPDVLHIEELDEPLPADDEILIRVHAVEATKADCELRSFNFAVIWFWLPLRLAMGLLRPRRQVLGGYFSGEVKAVGKDVSRFTIGDQIFGTTGIRFGAYAEYVCLPESCTLALKPDNVTFEEAAATPLGGLNALHFIRKAEIRPGEKVLVNGAGASIGSFGVQLAKAMGAEVTAVDSSIKEEMLRRIGADHFYDYTRQDIPAGGQTYDVIFNMVAGTSFSAWMNALKPGGRYLMANPRLSDMMRSAISNKFTDKEAIFAFAGEKEEELLVLKEMIEAGKIKPAVDRIYSYHQAAEAHRIVESEQRLGIVVLSMNPDAA